MPYAAKKICPYPGCQATAVTGRRYCQKHLKDKPIRRKDSRQSAAACRYDSKWRKLRKRVLNQAGIPEEEHCLYDLDHNPPYDPFSEPDHTAYTLIPRLKADHSRKTSVYDTCRDIKGMFKRSKDFKY